MTNQEKKLYNKEHYQKNRAVILDNMKSRYQAKVKLKENVLPLFGKWQSAKLSGGRNRIGENPPSQSLRIPSVRIGFGTFFLLLLAVGNTCFLISEMARFYAANEAVNQGSLISAFLKAFLLDGTVLALCLVVKSKTLIVSVVHGILVLVIYSYSIWVISSFAIQTAVSSASHVTLFEKRVHELETEITKQIGIRDAFYSAQQITRGSRLEGNIHELQKRLEDCRDALTQSPNVALVWNTLAAVVIFRILVMASNLVFLKELSRRFRLKAKAI